MDDRQDWLPKLPIVASTADRLYIATMQKLDALLSRLKARQRDLILEVAEHDMLPAAGALRQIAELENAIAAVEAVAAEERDARRPKSTSARP
ncbi:hypothetical protein GCM10007885_38140 [Methylobacterium gnaphalii]|nr:hypothetical protein GCM10007885_38140 [Methylobacterium gnaphalii]